MFLGIRKLKERRTQLRRIKKYEALMDTALARLDAGQYDDALSQMISQLEAYYISEDWKRDYADDEAGKLPKRLKRGVLSQDGLYDLLERFGELRGENE